MTQPPSVLLLECDRVVAESRRVRAKHRRRKGKPQDPDRRRELMDAYHATYEALRPFRLARAQARRQFDAPTWNALDRASAAVQAERRYLRRMLGRTRDA